MNKRFKQWINSALDFVFPQHLKCHSCSKEAAVNEYGICSECEAGLAVNPLAERIEFVDEYAAGLFYNDISKRAVYALKYNGAVYVREFLRVKLDDSDQSPGWKFAQYEMKGVPLRVEIGPKDMEKQQCCMARRDTGEKTFVPLSDLESAAQTLLQDVHDNLYAMAEKNLEDNTFDFTSWEEVRDMAQGRGGFARTKWCGSLECELAMKEKAGVSSRCMPLKQSGTVGKCPVCGKECTTDIYWGVAY